MRSPEAQMKRWLYFFVFFLWNIFLIFLLATRNYMAFLRPEFGILLAVACFISGAYMITSIFRPGLVKMEMSAVTRALVLLIPILYAVSIQDTMLGGHAFKQRFTGVTALNNRSMPFEAETDNYPDIPNQDRADNRKKLEEEDETETILSIYLNPEKYRGRHVKLTGMFQRDKELKGYFGGIETAVYRFVINCCAADALPLAIAFDSDQAAIYENDQWVQIEGIFDIRQMEGNRVPLIINPVIKTISTPSFPYLF